MEHGEIRSFLPEHVRAMEELEGALASGEAAAIQIAEQEFRGARNRLMRWVTDMEVDAEIEGEKFVPDPEIQEVIDRDTLLLARLKAIEQEQRDALNNLLRNKAAERDRETKSRLPRAVREKTFSRELLGDAIKNLRLLRDFSNNRKTTNHERTKYYATLQPIIECALAFRDNPDGITEEMRSTHELNIGLWERMYLEFGAELCALKTDNSDEARDRWINLCERIGKAFYTSETDDKAHEIREGWLQEQARNRGDRKGPRS